MGANSDGLERHNLFSCISEERADRGGVGDVAEALYPGQREGIQGCALLRL